MPPSGKCLHRIAPAATMVNKFVETTQNTNKAQLLASNYGTFRALVVYEIFIPQICRFPQCAFGLDWSHLNLDLESLAKQASTT